MDGVCARNTARLQTARLVSCYHNRCSYMVISENSVTIVCADVVVKSVVACGVTSRSACAMNEAYNGPYYGRRGADRRRAGNVM
jgi:hypothetical protein